MTETSNDSENNTATQTRLGIGRGKPLAKSEEVPPPTTTKPTPTSQNSGSTWSNSASRGFNNDDDNKNNRNNDETNNNFGYHNQRGGWRGSRGGGGGGGDRPCYNCNQTGHFARDCPQSRGERSDRGSHRGSFNRGGGYNGDRNQGNFRDDSNYRSSTQGEDGSLSVTVKNSSTQNENSRYSNTRGNNNSFASGERNRTFENSNRNEGNFNNDDGFGSRKLGFHSAGRPEQSSFAEKRSYNDAQDQNNPNESGRPPGSENYVPPPAPKTEDDIFGEATERGVNIKKYHDTHVQCTPEDKVVPIDVYDEANFPTQVLSNIRRANYTEPTAIQRYTIPCIQKHEDLMACAQTGSGKTAAFLLPIISNLIEYHQNDLNRKQHPPAPLCLVLSPTRELALQTEREARKFAFNTPIIPCSAIGGHDVHATSDRLKDGCHILSATTGRLKDMVERGRIQLNFVKYLVLDEADRMLHTDFEPDILKLIELGLPNKEQLVTSMFSATFPPEIQRLAKKFLREDYVFLAVGAIGGANEDITQTIEEVPLSHKKDRLFQLLEANLKDERCLIFVETKRSADYLGTLLSQRKFMSTTMHGDRTQQQRDLAVQQFTIGKCPILVATSVAARGLDFPLIGYVINYDLPDSTDFYIHRIGRTGRAGHLGKSISFFDPDRSSDRQIAPALVEKLMEAGQDVPEFLRQYSSANSMSSQGYNQPPRGGNVDMRNHGSNSRGGGFSSRGGFHSAGARGGTSSAGAAQDERW